MGEIRYYCAVAAAIAIHLPNERVKVIVSISTVFRSHVNHTENKISSVQSAHNDNQDVQALQTISRTFTSHLFSFEYSRAFHLSIKHPWRFLKASKCFRGYSHRVARAHICCSSKKKNINWKWCKTRGIATNESHKSSANVFLVWNVKVKQEWKEWKKRNKKERERNERGMRPRWMVGAAYLSLPQHFFFYITISLLLAVRSIEIFYRVHFLVDSFSILKTFEHRQQKAYKRNERGREHFCKT